MQQQLEVKRTERIVACDLRVGDTIAAHLTDGDDFSVTYYRVAQILDNRDGAETMTVELQYNYCGEPCSGDTRVVGIRRMGCVTLA